MKISSKELGRILIAFGKVLTEEGVDITENTHDGVMAHEDMGITDNTGSESSDIGSGSPFTAFADGTTENVDKTTNWTTEAEDTNVVEQRGKRIAELEEQLAKLQSSQNQSGLDLKPIKL